MSRRHDDIELPAVDRFDEYARTLFNDLRLSGRTPVAVVGSGMSVTYGGVSWGASVHYALEEAQRQIDAVLDPNKEVSERTKVRLKRAKDGIVAMIHSKYPSAPDKYLALDVAKEGMAIARSYASDAEQLNMPTFAEFMQRLFVSDAYFVAVTLQSRFKLDRKHKDGPIKLWETNPVRLQQLACHIYSLQTLRGLAGSDPDLVKLAGEIKVQLQEHYGDEKPDVLPLDRRSLLCLFLRGLDEAGLRQKYLELWLKFEDLSDEKLEGLRAPPRPMIDPIRALYEELGIRRFITLNFDLELENAMMIDDMRAIKGRGFSFSDAIEQGLLDRSPAAGMQLYDPSALDKLGVSRRFNDGLIASSDVYAEAAAARLFEFALNAPDYRAQILHLHGRADLPETMLLTEGDLNRIYRRNPRSRTTLEQALDVVLTGNSVLFAGIGLTEPEITRALRMLVSEGRATPSNPAFALMAYDQGAIETDKQGGSESWRHQMALFRQYGIHLIDAGHPRHGKQGGLPKQLQQLDKIIESMEAFRKSLATSEPNGIRGPARQKLREAVKANRHLSIAESIAIDGAAWSMLCDRLASFAGLNDCELHLAIDYAGKLREKLYSFCAEQEIKRLAESTVQRFAATSYLAKGEIPAVRETSMPMERLAYTSVRHDVVCEQKAPPAGQIGQHAQALFGLGPGTHCFLAPLGWGKGTLLRCLKQKLDGAQPGSSVIINCNLALEFESAIIQILRFVWFASNCEKDPFPEPVTDRITKLDRAMESGVKAGISHPTVILTGIERMIDSAGRPVTPEFEVVLRVLAKHANRDNNNRGNKWRVIVIGTPECTDFLKRCGLPVGQPVDGDNGASLIDFVAGRAKEAAQSQAPNDAALKRKLEAIELSSTRAIVPNGARSNASSALLKVVLEHWHDIAFARTLPRHEVRALAEFDKTILQGLAFIGQPVEIEVLRHLPNVIRAARAIDGNVSDTTTIDDACKRLASFGLVLMIAPFGGDSSPSAPNRIALHRTVMAEIRDRVGIRSGDEMLSNSFALTLAVSMPTDLIIAEADVYDSLKAAVGHQRGAWKDVTLSPDIQGALNQLRATAEIDQEGATLNAENALVNERIGQLERLVCLIAQPMQPRLRAAAGIVRGFLTAATLVAMIPDRTRPVEWAFGEFEEHKLRIEQLLARIREVRDARIAALALIEKFEEEWPGKFVASLKTISNSKELTADLRLEPLYSGELVWLLNELAVISMLQGNLYVAERSFREADRALIEHKGQGVRQSWRRLEINRALLRIERGHINQARLALVSIDKQMAQTGISAEWEWKLTSPLITGYIGLCDFLGGHYARAEESFKSVIQPLIDTDQQRALSLFYWRRGELLLSMRRWEEAEKQFRLGLAVAEAGRQMDVVWRHRISLTKVPDTGSPQMAEAILREAQGYASAMDIPRIALMVHSRRANLKLGLGDTQSAAAFATQAMQVASSNGMVLNRISTRTLMGRILCRQGDPSGEYLLRRAIAHADRIGYQLHVDRAQEALLEIAGRTQS